MSIKDEQHRKANLSSAENVKEAAHGKTAEHTMSMAAQTESPPKSGDGKAPYKEDFAEVYARLDAIELRLKHLEAVVAELTSRQLNGKSNGKPDGDIEVRVTNLEKRLEGNIA